MTNILLDLTNSPPEMFSSGFDLFPRIFWPSPNKVSRVISPWVFYDPREGQTLAWLMHVWGPVSCSNFLTHKVSIREKLFDFTLTAFIKQPFWVFSTAFLWSSLIAFKAIFVFLWWPCRAGIQIFTAVISATLVWAQFVVCVLKSSRVRNMSWNMAASGSSLDFSSHTWWQEF